MNERLINWGLTINQHHPQLGTTPPPRQLKQTPLLLPYTYPWKQELTESIPIPYRCLIAPYCIFKLSFIMLPFNGNYETFIKQFPFFENKWHAWHLKRSTFSCVRHLMRATFFNKCRAIISSFKVVVLALYFALWTIGNKIFVALCFFWPSLLMQITSR